MRVTNADARARTFLYIYISARELFFRARKPWAYVSSTLSLSFFLSRLRSFRVFHFIDLNDTALIRADGNAMRRYYAISCEINLIGCKSAYRARNYYVCLFRGFERRGDLCYVKA